ncbi:NAD(P)/FAD-dependent oxidoreductase [Paenibacillaceae bacterium WGS1546]|uniref:NAD(P)/FAD-dependent oxidoreductase n=1 Tax=Cohnella sp. WGS1546 TaxID=3366810 RepID=UPI00372D5793
MTLYYGSLYWPGASPKPARYAPLRNSRRTRVAIVGGGMSGTLCGYELAKAGIDAVLVERRRIASGSTAANTGLIQYSNDIMLSELAASIGEAAAARFYRACKQAAEKLCGIAAGLRRNVDFKRRASLYYASSPADAPKLKKEFETLRRHGLAAEWWDEALISANFPFRRAAGIVTRGDAEMNPYAFVLALAEEMVRCGGTICEDTAATGVKPIAGGGFEVATSDGSIIAEHVVCAVGYAVGLTDWLTGRPGMAGAALNRSYAIVTEPVPSLADWHERFLLWETARPYLYMRTTPDGRIAIGGLDEKNGEPVATKKELRVRSEKLLHEFRRMFPAHDPEIRYEWCATFGESADGLPWIGEAPDRPGLHYILGYGGNGAIYSMLGAELIRDALLGREHPVAAIVRPGRSRRQG